MAIFNEETQKQKQFEQYETQISTLAERIKAYDVSDADTILTIQNNFKKKLKDFYREDRMLNIGVVGQVKAGKSSFLNTLLFDGKEVLPKASTPKTATLTKMEYSEENAIVVEYYEPEEWAEIERKATVDSDAPQFISARELVEMVHDTGIDTAQYLGKGAEKIPFSSYEALMGQLNEYVGENGKFTPITKDVTLYLHNEAFQGLSIVDTPGLNDPILSRTIRTKEFMEMCDVVFFLSQASSFLDKSDWELLGQQLPQKGVKRLVLIASKYDSGLRDVLKKPMADDPFADLDDMDDNSTDNVAEAYKMVSESLTLRARKKVSEYQEELQKTGHDPELIEILESCKTPLMVSAMAKNMLGRPTESYNYAERNLAKALQPFTNNLEADLNQIGNFTHVQKVFSEVIADKEATLDQKASSFIPMSREELRSQLESFLKTAQGRHAILVKEDRNSLDVRMNALSQQANAIRADVAAILDELNDNLKNKQMRVRQELREFEKENLSIKEHTETRSVPYTYYTSFFFFFTRTHTGYRDESHNYMLASDAAENLRKFTLDASGRVELAFTEAINLNLVRKKLLDVVIQNFDLSDENFDSNSFRIKASNVVQQIEFPTISISCDDEINHLTANFQGKIESQTKMDQMKTALASSLSQVTELLFQKTETAIHSFVSNLNQINNEFVESITAEIGEELQLVANQLKDKDIQIQNYANYEALLKAELQKLGGPINDKYIAGA